MRAIAMGWRPEQHQLGLLLQVWKDNTAAYSAAVQRALEALQNTRQAQQTVHASLLDILSFFLAGETPSFEAPLLCLKPLLLHPPGLLAKTVSELHMGSTAAIAQRADALRRVAKAREGDAVSPIPSAASSSKASGSLKPH